MKKLIVLSLLCLALTSCASRKLSETEKSSIIEAYITDEKLEQRSTVSAFSLDSWTPLSDQYLILRTSPFRPYLVKLASRCHDLDFSPTLVIDSRMSGSLSTGFDSVYTPQNQVFKCYISRIYSMSKEQNKAIISAVNPKAEDKPAEKTEAAQQDQALLSP
tara:strand:- start:2112 stop:2594 length:483 start_codon:yes stop_codon:yes gene_type:complete